MKRIFFLDFDGTITLEDSCFLMIQQFCRPGWEEINEQWEQGGIGTLECARRTFALFEASREELVMFLQQIPVDPGFKDFVKIAEENGDSIFILSDGYDLNIKTIFAANGIEPIPFYANKLLYTAGKFDLDSPYHNPLCEKCGTCKTNLLEKLRGEENQTIYIGDGSSDKCPVKQADIIFAKEKLMAYCKKQGYPAKGFERFQEIIEWMEEAGRPACKNNSTF